MIDLTGKNHEMMIEELSKTALAGQSFKYHKLTEDGRRATITKQGK